MDNGFSSFTYSSPKNRSRGLWGNSRGTLILKWYTLIVKLYNKSKQQAIARKIIRPLANYEEADIQNETRIVETLGMGEGHKNIVQVFSHGRLPKTPCYYIDMELCDFTLNNYILEDWEKNQRDKIPETFIHQSPNNLIPNARQIMIDIAEGVIFIHSHGLVHRDLKPANSTVSIVERTHSSSVFERRPPLEDQ
jgi:serine/threonine protein kinase